MSRALYQVRGTVESIGKTIYGIGVEIRTEAGELVSLPMPKDAVAKIGPHLYEPVVLTIEAPQS